MAYKTLLGWICFKLSALLLRLRYFWSEIKRSCMSNICGRRSDEQENCIYIQLLLAVCAEESCLLENSAVFTISHSSRLCVLCFCLLSVTNRLSVVFLLTVHQGGYSTVGLQEQAGCPLPTEH